MRSPFAARGLPAETYTTWRDSLAGWSDVPLRVLAWARADDDGVVVGSPAVLSISVPVVPVPTSTPPTSSAPTSPLPTSTVPTSPRGDEGEAEEGAEQGDASVPTGSWRHVGWHEIEHGGWNAESRSLSWTLYGGRRGRVGLREPGRLPELFRERVAASIVVERFVPIRGERGVTVTARRDLGGSGAITWHSTLTRGLTWSTPGVSEEAARASAELQSEYGSASAGW